MSNTLKTLRKVKAFRTTATATESKAFSSLVKSLKAKRGSINDLLQSKCVTGLVSLMGKTAGAYLANELANLSDNDGHLCRGFLRRFGVEFTKEENKYKVKAFSVKFATAEELKKVAQAAKFEEKESKTATAKTAKVVKTYTASAEGLNNAKAKLAKSFATSVKSLKCPVLEMYFMTKFENMLKSMNTKGISDNARKASPNAKKATAPKAKAK